MTVSFLESSVQFCVVYCIQVQDRIIHRLKSCLSRLPTCLLHDIAVVRFVFFTRSPNTNPLSFQFAKQFSTKSIWLERNVTTGIPQGGYFLKRKEIRPVIQCNQETQAYEIYQINNKRTSDHTIALSHNATS
jgi:hypothetical protein